MLVQVRVVPKCRYTHISNYQSTERESYERDETSLTIIPNVSSRAPSLLLEYVKAYPLLHKGLGHLAAPYLLYLLLLVTIYLITKLSITYYFSACRENLTENRLSLPSAPHWVQHSYFSKGLR